jgi:phosphoserine phosphatase
VILPSWNEGAARSEVLAFLDASTEIAPEHRVAVFDNDGTLWCERPNYPQLVFLLDELQRAVEAEPGLADRPEYAALLSGDRAVIAQLGLERLALALVEIFEGLEPEGFEERVRRFFATAIHPDKGVGYGRLIYQPMLELMDALRDRNFAVCIVTGGGTEFVRTVSNDLYGVPPERVVGTLVSYEMKRRDDGQPVLVRAAQSVLDANEGVTKVTNIQTALGRRPIFAAGNSAGDGQMMEYAMASKLPSLALLVDHDDAEREYAYESKAQTFEEDEPITVVARRLGWTVVSMARDWSRVFPGEN